MPQHKSAKKRIKQNNRKKSYNLIALSKYKSSIKEFEENLKSKNQEKLIKLLSKVNSLGSKAVKRKIIEKNKISRKISKLSRMIQSKSWYLGYIKSKKSIKT